MIALSHAPWIYGWWAQPAAVQAWVLLAETGFLFLLFTVLTLLAFRQSPRGAEDPARRMMEDDR